MFPSSSQIPTVSSTTEDKDDVDGGGGGGDFSSLGVQVLSESLTSWGSTFNRAGGLKSNLSVEEEQDGIEPTATTYRPNVDYVKPRAPNHPMYDRLDGVKWSDKFAALTGPGSYEELGSVGVQCESTKANSGKAVFSREDRLKFMGSFAVS